MGDKPSTCLSSRVQTADAMMHRAIQLLSTPSGESMASALEALRSAGDLLSGMPPVDSQQELPDLRLEQAIIDLVRSRWMVLQLLSQIGVTLEAMSRDHLGKHQLPTNSFDLKV